MNARIFRVLICAVLCLPVLVVGCASEVDRLSEKLEPGHDWRLYWDHQDILPMTKLIHPGLLHRRYHGHFRSMERFADDCRTGDLPAYTFIQPRLIVNHNDMHPPVSLVRMRIAGPPGGVSSSSPSVP